MMDFINNFKKRIQVNVKGAEKRYEVEDIFIQEDNLTGICKAYVREGTEKINDSKIRRVLVNIKDERDVISYEGIALPGGRCRKINEHADIFSLYNFGSMFYALYGEEKMPYAMITKQDIDELISLYETQKQLMKYYELEEVRCKGKVAYIGRYLEAGGITEKELFGNVLFESGCGWNGIDVGSRKILVNNRCIRDFRYQKHDLNFTESALQNIVERYKNREKQCE